MNEIVGELATTCRAPATTMVQNDLKTERLFSFLNEFQNMITQVPTTIRQARKAVIPAIIAAVAAKSLLPNSIAVFISDSMAVEMIASTTGARIIKMDPRYAYVA